MTIILPALVLVLFASGLFLIQRHTVVKVLFGIVLIGNAANLLVFSSTGMRLGSPPILEGKESTLPPGASDPVAQALVLTAIVISFALTVLALALARRLSQSMGDDDLDKIDEGAET
jgi:multicomponent Na+:H+ antiporter subunit C